ncbi:MAG: leucyl/phenylalanyl-tRNA--protein transferase [Methylobacteriaceae bacterium]|nr:leucyl/phenylalanyl-tRNA--protein transferase [Methylobacteriaceae bacterium]
MTRRTPRPEITPDIILRAYSVGLFPMAEQESDERLFWVDPEERGVFPLDALVVSRSLAKAVRSDRFEIAVDADFDSVIEGCAHAGSDRDRTWINAPIRRLYRELFDMGFVHTVECRREGRLVGGLYGVALGAAFFGESMFHLERDASKVALVHLAARLRAGGFALLDTQFVTPHLASLGAVAVPRAEYRRVLDAAVSRAADFLVWPSDAKISGADALAVFRTAT